ncbi:MAG: hypothetical protein AAGH79_18295, partial [Bacteroidota bacterium]
MKLPSLVLFSLLLLSIRSLTSQNNCLPDGIIFTSQAEIDAFPSSYSGCAVIDGGVIIQENQFGDITSLDSLYSIKQVNGYFQINGNLMLPSLAGLDNLESADGGLDIFFCPAIENLDALASLSYTSSLGLVGNASLQNVDGLSNLTTIEQYLSIQNNAVLEDIDGLQNLNIVKDIRIIGCALLTNLDALSNLSVDGLELIEFFSNDNLSVCDNPIVCQYLLDGGTASIFDNALGCNNQMEVEDACLMVSSSEAFSSQTVQVYPNPSGGPFHVEGINPGTPLVIYNTLGEWVHQTHLRADGRIDLS